MARDWLVKKLWNASHVLLVQALEAVKHDEDDEPLCSTCSALGLCSILCDGVPEKHALPLGYLTDILSSNEREQCKLCRPIAIRIRRRQKDCLPHRALLDMYAIDRMSRLLIATRVWSLDSREGAPSYWHSRGLARLRRREKMDPHMVIVPAPRSCRYIALSYV
ncbi:hypothetical protein M405DRAFT_826103 [Rhizopogon salebrosus TDB-379]|nr:hypothetical protein M405DRAFT_826103 [Rhizopogon salebrosus TDB-379]